MPRVADPRAKIALLAAAEAVFAARGVDAARVEEITRRAGTSKGAFYLHFESKEEALKQICESFLARCTELFRPPGEQTLPDDPDEVLVYWLAKDVEFYEVLWQNRATVSILNSCQGPHSYLLEAFMQGLVETSRSWVEHWRSRGLFRTDIDPEVASVLLFGAYDALAHRMLALATRPPIEAWLAEAQAFTVRGFGTAAFAAAVDRVRSAPRSKTTRTNGSTTAPRRRSTTRKP